MGNNEIITLKFQMPLIALTLAAVISLSVAQQFGKLDEEKKQKPRKKKITHTKKLYEEGMIMDRYMMNSNEYPFFDAKDFDKNRRRGRSLSTRSSVESSFIMS